MLILAFILKKYSFLHLFEIDFSIESYLLILIGTLLFLVLGYILRVQQIKSNERKLLFLVDKRTKLISKQKEEIENQNQLIQIEKEKSDQLLLNLLPDYIVKELKQKDSVAIKTHLNVSVMFIDIVGFSKIAEVAEPKYLVNKLNDLFTKFDGIIEKYDLEKIKTIGDAYLVAGGLGFESKINAVNCVLAALEVQDLMKDLKNKAIKQNKDYWNVRVGIHNGEVISGVLGTNRIAYDIFGNTVNIAERMQTNCQPGKVNISESTYHQINLFFNTINRGEIPTKNTGDINMFFVDSLKFTYKKENSILNNYWLTEILNFYSQSKLDFFGLNKFVIEFLKNKLSSNLYYHGVHHTEDVVQSLDEICFHEKVNPEEYFILKTAVLFHDMGYIDQYNDNEIFGVKYAEKILPKYNFSKSQIKKISNLILATKVPQNPKNKLEKIICDADLDYLGRVDFLEISDSFFKELKERKFVNNQNHWDELQVDFFEEHTYFTDFSKNNRNPMKQKNLKFIKERLNK